jgi:catechol 2,3-dioxygenase-like lactoylglutathione lyase family enzyme
MPAMRLDAVSVATANFQRAAEFYALLGFVFPSFDPEAKHLEAVAAPGEIRLLIDDKAMMKELIGKDPAPATHSCFAIKCESPAGVDAAVAAIKAAGFTIVREPWDAFWGQRYAVVADPDGYMSDLFAPL